MSDMAVLLMSLGGPLDLDEVDGFLSRFLGGRLPSREKIEEVREKYRLIGGRSPLNEITLRQVEALERELARRGSGVPVLAGLRFSKPSVDDAVAQVRDQGVRQLVALPLAPHRSRLSTEPYFSALKRVMIRDGVTFKVQEITGWHAHPRFLEALDEKITEGVSRFAAKQREDVEIVFSAHSLPEKSIADDPYVDDIHETIRGVLERMGPRRWHLAFQSRGGGSEPWLKPEVGEVIDDLSRKGADGVLVVPVGFVSDHLETLYDLDIKYRKQAESRGMHYERSPSLNDSPRFIEALAQVVLEGLEGFL
jgi:ferrochelatase